MVGDGSRNEPLRSGSCPLAEPDLAAVVAAFGAAAAAYLAVKRAGEDEDRSSPVRRRRARAARSVEVARIGTKAGGTYALAPRPTRVRVGGAPARSSTREHRAADGGAGRRRARPHEGRADEDRPDGELPRPGPARAGARAARAAPGERAADVGRAGRAGRRARSSARRPEQLFDDVGSGAVRGRVDRPGAPRDHEGRPRRRGQGAVPRRRRGDRMPTSPTRDCSCSVIGMVFPGLEPEPIVEELRERVREELDYVHEADNQRLFADYYADHPFIHIPAVRRRAVDEAGARPPSSPKGARFDELLTWSQDEKDLAAEAIYRFVFGSLYRLQRVQRRPAPRQLPVPARRGRDVPRLRTREAVHARRDRDARARCPRPSPSTAT